MTKSGVKQNAFISYARRRLWFEVVDPGSIPGISTIGALWKTSDSLGQCPKFFGIGP